MHRLSGIIFFLCVADLFSQTATTLPEVPVVASYLSSQNMLELPASTSTLDLARIREQHGQSLVPVLNTVPGVRMEERSPGSYRLSIRWSLLRSPFGVRNIKVYFDELPFTNAAGETYLNLIDQNSIASLELNRGPDGSIFGANSGGVVRLEPVHRRFKNEMAYVSGGTGSFGLLQENVMLQKEISGHFFTVKQAFQRSDGFREHSGMIRKYIQITDRLNYGRQSELRAHVFYSDLCYETPGGLTLSQYQHHPRQSRPGNALSPGASEQNASVRNRSFFGGLVNEAKVGRRTRHVIAVGASQTLFENPFITNYEIRDEMNASVRTWIEVRSDSASWLNVKYYAGGEFQDMQSLISNFSNDRGFPDTLQAEDRVNSRQGFIFNKLLVRRKKFSAEAAVSLNKNWLAYQSVKYYGPEYSRSMPAQWMPRIALSYLLRDDVSVRLIGSRGYSPPGLQEIRASNQLFNDSLLPEDGWNYETGFRWFPVKNRLSWDANIFYYEMRNAIVRNTDANGEEYFSNSGIVFQNGFESALRAHLIPVDYRRRVRMIELASALTLYNFRFGAGAVSGQKVTGVPPAFIVSSVRAEFRYGVYLFVQHNYVSAIPLNDMNTVHADPFNLLMMKIGRTMSRSRKVTMEPEPQKRGFWYNVFPEVSVGVDNLLDVKYSLGNDLNAFGGRYFNVAPGRNFFLRIAAQI